VNAYVCNGTNATTPTRAKGPCFDNAHRYVDCGNGTVTDNLTGLIWLKQWDCLSRTDWKSANERAAGLKHGDCTLTDGSSPGDWRLPTKAEWEATIARAVYLGCTISGGGYSGVPSLTNDAGTACYTVGPSSFAGMWEIYFWSGTLYEVGSPNAWFVDLENGNVNSFTDKTTIGALWPVRAR
jgi:hypothetical protein